jgi:thiamine-phosphate pyrophosphorylase
MRLDAPITCLVTDRTRLSRGADRFDQMRHLVNIAREAVEAGVDLIQVRERGLETAALFDLVGEILQVARGAPTRVVVNDRLDVALAAGADGVHLRADSIAPRLVRPLVPARFLVGRSVHDAGEAQEHAPFVDYLVAGTVFATPSKPSSSPLLGVSGLTDVVRAVRVPVLAIGGMIVGGAAQVAATGAAGVAAISLFLSREPRMAETLDVLRKQFDTVRAAS